MARSKGRNSASCTPTAPGSVARARASSARSELAHEAIAREAYRIWEHAGRPDGQQVMHWLQAEQRLRASPPPV